MSKEVKAINKMIRTSSQKLNLIVKDIRKKDINAALNILKFSLGHPSCRMTAF